MNIALNKKAFYNYDILEKLEAGLVLAGMEVKSIRQRQVDIKDAYAIINNKQEAWIVNMKISTYKFDGRAEIDTNRSRKLLLKKKEIKKLFGKLQEKGLTLVPLKLYLSRGLVKVQLGLGKAKKLFDKRETKKRKDINREMERALSDRF